MTENEVNLIKTAVDALKARNAAQNAAHDADVALKAVMFALYHDYNHGAPEVSRILIAAARGSGVDDAGLIGLGHDTVRSIVGNRRHPKPRPT